jgi:predicted ATPase
MKTYKYVLTGGPCVGKTTILDLISLRGITIVPEAARYVIEIEQAKDGDALPWKDNAKFQKRVMDRQLELENDLDDGIVFLDRGLIDGHGYCKHFGTATPEGLIELSVDRYEKIFLLDQLPNYNNDESRLENFEEATRIHEAIADAYISLGYGVIRVPVLSPDKRVEFILNRI